MIMSFVPCLVAWTALWQPHWYTKSWETACTVSLWTTACCATRQALEPCTHAHACIQSWVTAFTPACACLAVGIESTCLPACCVTQALAGLCLHGCLFCAQELAVLQKLWLARACMVACRVPSCLLWYRSFGWLVFACLLVPCPAACCVTKGLADLCLHASLFREVNIVIL